jgi:hypothetical protein
LGTFQGTVAHMYGETAEASLDREAEAAVAGSEWRHLGSATAADSSRSSVLYEHEITKERRRVVFSRDIFWNEDLRLTEIHRQLE